MDKHQQFSLSHALAGDHEHHVHAQTDGDHRDSVDQTHHDEELGTQQRQQIRLTSSAFQELTTQHTDTNGGADSSQTHHHTSSNKQHFHGTSSKCLQTNLKYQPDNQCSSQAVAR